MEARQSVRWNGQGEEVSYAPLSDSRHFAMEVARFWHAEGHHVDVRRAYGTDVNVMVWGDTPGASWILCIDVRAWQ